MNVFEPISFEEFIILFFLTKFKSREVAEIKLFEFLVSLKYYFSKNSLKAVLFITISGSFSLGKNESFFL
jgi:hypothetical protein